MFFLLFCLKPLLINPFLTVQYLTTLIYEYKGHGWLLKCPWFCGDIAINNFTPSSILINVLPVKNVERMTRPN